MKRTSHNSLAAAAICALVLSGSAAFAHGGPPAGAGGGRPGGMPQGVPGGMPQGINRPSGTPGSMNPNSAVPTTAPPTGRGQSGTAPGRTANTTSARPTVGKVASFSGTTLTLTLPTGQIKTFTVDAHAFGQLKPGTPVAVTSQDGTTADTIAPANQMVTGTVSSVTRNSVTMTLPNGKTVTVMVPSQAAGHIPLTPGSQAQIISNDGGFSASQVRAVNDSPTTNKGTAVSGQHRHMTSKTHHVNANATSHANINSSKNPHGVNGTATNRGTATPRPIVSPSPSPAPTTTP
ncbi:MAG: hypothetical protein ABR584_10180 [Candidatus Baltobacteraceae bacterium]